MKYFYLAIFIILANTNLSAENYYWIGGTGDWNEPVHWSLSEFGTGESANAIPTMNDNVYFNEFSFENDGDTLYVSQSGIFCREMDWTSLSKSVVFFFNTNPNEAKRVNISGSLLLSPDVQVSGDDALWMFNSTSVNNLVYTAENQLPHAEFNNENGSWQLFDDLNVRGVIRHWGGELLTGNKAISCRNFMSTGSTPRRLVLGNSTLEATQELKLENSNLDLDSGTSTLSCSILNASGMSLNDVIFLIGQQIPSIVGGNVSFNSLSFGTEDILSLLSTDFLNTPLEFILPAGSSISIANSFFVGSICENPVIVRTSEPGVQAFIYNQAGIITLQHVHLRDVNANGGKFIALYSYDDGNNEGWQFIGDPGICALPVELTDFEADCQNRNTHLQWTTETESNSAHFAVEVSRDGATFEEVTKISAAGSSISPQNYSFTDPTLRVGEHYYRLKKVDIDGNYDYSEILAITCVNAEPASVEIFPNPVKDVAAVHLNLATNVDIRATIFDAQGQLISEKNQELGEGFHNINFDTQLLSKGVYIMQVCINEQCEAQKLIKQ